ncbi:hypothetical protein D3H35_16550 [Cohnella faecalis]|uniref:Extracellular solute-binding protein n=1 Tax=Cohnella faecalis TaxID=2315694 RepID=A0A398CR75_9BACL|nr:hypothetical protein D3H35_16550 [Cohnella faecalis]
MTDFHNRVKTLAKSDADAQKAFLDGNEGDVWVTTEQKALQLAESAGKGKIEIVVPSVTLTVEPIVSVVDRNADDKGIREVANAYTDYLFTEEAQTSAAKFGFRSRFASVAEQNAGKFPEVSLLTVDDNLTGWEDLQQALFSDSGLFKQLPAK